jgi:hypothetical protein
VLMVLPTNVPLKVLGWVDPFDVEADATVDDGTLVADATAADGTPVVDASMLNTDVLDVVLDVEDDEDVEATSPPWWPPPWPCFVVAGI